MELSTNIEELEDRIAPGQAPFCIAVTAGAGAEFDSGEVCNGSDERTPPEIILNGELIRHP